MLHPLSIHQSIFNPFTLCFPFFFHSFPSFKIFIYFVLHVWEFCLNVCMCITYMAGAHGIQRGESDTLELELWMFVSHHIGAGNWVLLLCRHKCWVISPAPLPSLSASPHLPLSTYLVPSVHSTSPFYAAIYPPMPFPSVRLYTRLVHKVNPQHPGTGLVRSENGVANKANLDILWLKASAIWWALFQTAKSHLQIDRLSHCLRMGPASEEP